MTEPARLARELMATFDEDEFKSLLIALVDIPSPSGEELAIASFCREWLASRGVGAVVQPLDETQANCLARIKGSSVDGASLLLYAPLDTHLGGAPDEDVPGVGDTLPDIYKAQAQSLGDEVAGLGAENPKAFVACLMSVARMLAAQELALKGDLLVGLGAGGMPTNRRPTNTRFGVGHGVGVSYMLEQGFRPDYAVIAKPVWQVSWEEAGLAWFRIRVRGIYGYAGLRHRVPYRNAIDAAGRLVNHLEQWFPKYSEQHARGAVAPQGVVGAIEGGWPFRPAFTPASCDVYVDLRVHPDDDPVVARRALENEIATFCEANPDVETTLEMLLAIPGSRTNPDNWIIRSCIKAWEEMEGRQHEPLTNYSGSTDANVLRLWGVPTARIGVPQRAGETSWAGSDPMPMNLVSVSDCKRLVELLLAVALDTCGRDISETQASGAK